MVSGKAESPVDGVTFRNAHLRITGFENVESATPVPNTPASHATVSAALIFEHAQNVSLTDVRITWDTKETPSDRHALFGDHVEALRLSGFSARQSDPGGQRSVIYLKDSRDIAIRGSRAEPGATAFLYLDGINESEVLMEGNDLRHARRTPQP